MILFLYLSSVPMYITGLLGRQYFTISTGKLSTNWQNENVLYHLRPSKGLRWYRFCFARKYIIVSTDRPGNNCISLAFNNSRVSINMTWSDLGCVSRQRFGSDEIYSNSSSICQPMDFHCWEISSDYKQYCLQRCPWQRIPSLPFAVTFSSCLFHQYNICRGDIRNAWRFYYITNNCSRGCGARGRRRRFTA